MYVHVKEILFIFIIFHFEIFVRTCFQRIHSFPTLSGRSWSSLRKSSDWTWRPEEEMWQFFPFLFVHCPLHTFRYKLPFYTSKKEKNGNELRRSMLKNQTPSYIPQQGYLINTLKPKREKIIWNLGTCVLSLLMGAELLLINLEKVAEKTKWEVRIGGQVSEMQLTAGKDKMRGKMVATDWC